MDWLLPGAVILIGVLATVSAILLVAHWSIRILERERDLFLRHLVTLHSSSLSASRSVIDRLLPLQDRFSPREAIPPGKVEGPFGDELEEVIIPHDGSGMDYGLYRFAGAEEREEPAPDASRSPQG